MNLNVRFWHLADIDSCSPRQGLCGVRRLAWERRAFAELIREDGNRARLGHVHPHMLRHSCRYYLANKGVDFRTAQNFLGHRDPKHTTRYTRVAGPRFEGLWD